MLYCKSHNLKCEPTHIANWKETKSQNGNTIKHASKWIGLSFWFEWCADWWEKQHDSRKNPLVSTAWYIACFAITWNAKKTEMKSHFAVDGFKRNKCKSLVQSKPGRQKEWMLNFVRSFLLNGKFTNLQYVHPLSFQVLFTKRKPLQHMYISLIIILKTNTLRMNFFSIAHPFWSIYIHILPQLRSY